MEGRNEQMAHRIAEAVSARGGRTYFVGGLVRDRIMGRENHDLDLEIHGLAPETLRLLLGEHYETDYLLMDLGREIPEAYRSAVEEHFTLCYTGERIVFFRRTA